jgi:hypothetical protein
VRAKRFAAILGKAKPLKGGERFLVRQAKNQRCSGSLRLV